MGWSKAGFRGADVTGFYLALCSAALLFVMQAPAHAQSVATHHVRAAVVNGQARFLRPMPATESLRLDVVLPLRDQAGLDKFLKDLYDPSSPSFRRFLTVSEFTARFGPAQEDYDALTSYLVSNGLTVVGGSRDGMELQVEGSVAAIGTAFSVSMGIYQHPTESRTFYAPDREPTVGLPFPLWHVSGLDNYSIPHPMMTKRSDTAEGRDVSHATGLPQATTGSGPAASFLGSDMRAAYYGGTALTGAGQSLGLFEFFGTDLADLTTYYKNAGQTNSVPITLFSVDGTATTCLVSANCDDYEQTIDMTQALGMAPGLSSLVLFIGSNDTAIVSAMTTHSPLPTTISCSWGWTPADPTSLDPYFQKMAAQGQNFFAASGDTSTWSATSEAWPADDPYVVSVGGTTLVTSGGAWKSETAWAGSGGGPNIDGIAIPAWQQISGVVNSSNKGSTVYRNGPDVAANAAASFYVCADQTACTANGYSGTSFAAPMWAGYLALVNQQAASKGLATLGFINPLIYSLGVGSGYGSDFHDITSGASGSYSAVTGYDLVTGWGSPNGVGLIDALTGTPTPADFTLSASPTSVSVAQGSSGTSTITTAVSGGLNSAMALTASGEPTGVTVAFSPASVAAPGSGTSTMTMTVASTAVAGSYPITVTATGGGVTHTSSVTLKVTAPGSFTISASATLVTVALGAKGTSSITTAISGSFKSAVALTASGLPTGTTAAFSPASIASPGSGSSILTLTVGTSTAIGIYPITVTGTGGGVTQTTSVTLTVNAAAFTISASPTSVSVVAGHTGTWTVSTAVSGGFSSAIALSASGMPSGVTVSFSPTSIAAPGSGTSTMTLTVAATAATGTHTIVVSGTGGGLTHTSPVILSVTAPPAFTIAASPSSVSVNQGATGTSTITTTVSGGFNSAIALTASGLPTGATAAFSTTPIAAPGSGTSTLTFTVGTTTAAGTYPITVTGTGGSLTHTASVSLTVVAPAFTQSASPASVSVALGASGTSTITTAVSGGFNSAIALSATGQPAGVTVTFNPASVAAPGAGTSTMTITVASTVTPASYPITVTGTGGGITHTSTVTLTVPAPPGFSVSASPAAVSVALGAKGTSTIATKISGSFSSAIALSASGLPSGTTAAFSPASITAPGSGSSTVTFTVGSTTAVGVYPITVTATGGGITQTATVTLTTTVATTALTLKFTSATGKVGTAFTGSLTAAGGKSPYTFSVGSGRLPAGLTLNTTTGAITGTPTAVVNGSAANITFKVVDSAGSSATASGTITIAAAGTKVARVR